MAKISKIPGVFIEEVANPSLAIATTTLRSVGIVGTAPTYYVTTETVTRGATYTDTLSSVLLADLVGVSSIYYSGSVVVSSDAYTISGLSIVWDSSKIPTYLDEEGAQYTVVLKVNKSAEYYDALTFTGYDSSLTNVYGYPIVNGEINQISAAAKLAFDAGAPRVVAVQAATAGLSDIKSAIDKLENEDVRYIVCPGITDTTLQTYLKNHVETMSSADGKMERMAFVAPLTLTDNRETIMAQCEGLNTQYLMNVVPGSVNMTLSNGATDYSVTASSIYAGASLAGRLANPTKRIAKPLTRESVLNIDSVNEKYYKTDRELLAGAGALVLYTDKSGVVKVNQGLTTDNSNYNNSEVSVVNIKLESQIRTREALDEAYIGGELDSTKSPSDVIATLVNQLESQKGELIVSYKDVTAVVSSTDPSAIEVSYSIAVIRPFNYINIKYIVTA